MRVNAETMSSATKGITHGIRKSRVFSMIFLFVSALVILMFEVFFRSDFNKVEDGWIMWLQNKAKEKAGSSINLVITLAEIAGPPPDPAAFILSVTMCAVELKMPEFNIKKNTSVLLPFGWYIIVLNSIAKILRWQFGMLFHQPRPFWRNSDINMYHCPTTFGFPSGHFVLWMMLILPIVNEIVNPFVIARESLPPRHKLWFALTVSIDVIYGITSIFFILMFLSRMFLGTHYPRDMIFGALLSHIVLRVLTRKNMTYLWKPMIRFLKGKWLRILPLCMIMVPIAVGFVELTIALANWFLPPDDPMWSERAALYCPTMPINTRPKIYGYRAIGSLCGALIGVLPFYTSDMEYSLSQHFQLEKSGAMKKQLSSDLGVNSYVYPESQIVMSYSMARLAFRICIMLAMSIFFTVYFPIYVSQKNSTAPIYLPLLDADTQDEFIAFFAFFIPALFATGFAASNAHAPHLTITSSIAPPPSSKDRNYNTNQSNTSPSTGSIATGASLTGMTRKHKANNQTSKETDRLLGSKITMMMMKMSNLIKIKPHILNRAFASKANLTSMLIEDVGTVLNEHRKDIMAQTEAAFTPSSLDVQTPSSNIKNQASMASISVSAAATAESIPPTPDLSSIRNMKPIRSVQPGDEDFVLVGRITSIYPLRNFTSSNDGKQKSVQALDIIDENQDEVRISFFTKAITPKVQEAKVGQVYSFYIPKKFGKVNQANPKYPTANDKIDIQVTFGGSVDPLDGQFNKIPLGKVRNILSVKQLSEQSAGTSASTIAIIHSHGEVETGTSLSGSEWKRVVANIMDESGACDVTIWGKDIDLLFNRPQNVPPVFAFSGCSRRSEEYTLSARKLIMWPKHKRSTEIASWYASNPSEQKPFKPEFSPYVKGVSDFYAY